MALVTAETARGYLQGFDALQDDAELTRWLAAAESVLHAWLKFPRTDAGTRVLDASTYTVYLDGPAADDPYRLDVGLWPIVSITSIGDDENWDYTQTVSSAEYSADLDRGQLHLLPTSTHAWSRSRRSIRVICTAGFTASDVDVVTSIVLTARHLWEKRHTEGVPNAAELTTDVAQAIPEMVRRMMAPHRLWQL